MDDFLIFLCGRMSSVITRFLVSKIMDFLMVAWAPSCHLISCLIRKTCMGDPCFLVVH